MKITRNWISCEKLGLSQKPKFRKLVHKNLLECASLPRHKKRVGRKTTIGKERRNITRVVHFITIIIRHCVHGTFL